MKNIRHIFKTDILNLIKNPAALLVIAAVVFLPSLYAWFNIISSWDPYSNTRGLTIAVANLDEGANLDGKDVQVGNEIVATLKENEKLGWVFVSEDEAMQGVRHGDYYASIIIPAHFSKDMLSVITGEFKKPELDYYINEKINAIAPKVTGAGASGIVENVSSNFVKTANMAIFNVFNEIGVEVAQNRPSIEKIVDIIYKLESDMPEIERVIQTAQADLSKISDVFGVADQGLARVKEIGEYAESLSGQLDALLVEADRVATENAPTVIADLQTLQERVRGVSEIIDTLMASDLPEQLLNGIKQAAEGVDRGQAVLQRLSDVLDYLDLMATEEGKLQEIRNRLTAAQNSLEGLKGQLSTLIGLLEKGEQPAKDLILKIQELSQQANDRLTRLIELHDSQIVPLLQGAADKLTQASQKLGDGLVQFRELVRSGETLFTDWASGANWDPDAAKSRLDGVNSQIGDGIQTIQLLIERLERLEALGDQPLLQASIKGLQESVVRLEDIQKSLAELIQAIDHGEQPGAQLFEKLAAQFAEAGSLLDQAIQAYDGNIVAALQAALARVTQIDQQVRETLGRLQEAAQGAAALAGKLLGGSLDLAKVKSALQNGMQQIQRAQDAIQRMVGLLDRAQALANGGILHDAYLRTQEIAGQVQKLSDLLARAYDMVERGQQPAADMLMQIRALTTQIDQAIEHLWQAIDDKLGPAFAEVSETMKQAIGRAQSVIQEANAALPDIENMLHRAEEGIQIGQNEIARLYDHFPAVQTKLVEIADRIRQFEQSGDLDRLLDFMSLNPEAEGEFFAHPVGLKEHPLFPIPNYGSAMSPFFSTLSLWVGALLLVSLVKVDVENKHLFKSYEVYFGRFLTFLVLGLGQALIVTLGDIFILKAYVVDKIWFVLFGMFISAIFVMIVYTLVSVFGNVGKAMSIILLVLQLSGSGGTFPIQMAPEFFQKIHPFLPFTHAIVLMREAVGGLLWSVAWKHLLIICAYIVLSLIIGIALKKTFNKSSDRFLEKAKESKLII